MSGFFHVNLDAFAATSSISQAAADANDHSLQDIVAEAGAGLAGTETATTALPDVGVQLGGGVAGFAEMLDSTAETLTGVATNYREADERAAETFRRLIR